MKPEAQKVSDMTGVELIWQALNGERGEDQQKIAAAGMQIVELLLRKNRDYGSSAWKRPVLAPSLEPRTAMLCRMSDKIERIQSLLEKGGNEVKDESLNDTFRDLCGYLMLYVAFEG
jgi:Nucleotide modification associated domain 1